MISHEQLYVLSKARWGVRLREETAEFLKQLIDQGLVRRKRSFWGPKFHLTDNGRRELFRAGRSSDKLVRAIAAGLFDHLPITMFEQIISSPKVSHFIDGQREVQQLALLSLLHRPW